MKEQSEITIVRRCLKLSASAKHNSSTMFTLEYTIPHLNAYFKIDQNLMYRLFPRDDTSKLTTAGIIQGLLMKELRAFEMS